MASRVFSRIILRNTRLSFRRYCNNVATQPKFPWGKIVYLQVGICTAFSVAQNVDKKLKYSESHKEDLIGYKSLTPGQHLKMVLLVGIITGAFWPVAGPFYYFDIY